MGSRARCNTTDPMPGRGLHHVRMGGMGHDAAATAYDFDMVTSAHLMLRPHAVHLQALCQLV